MLLLMLLFVVVVWIGSLFCVHHDVVWCHSRNDQVASILCIEGCVMLIQKPKTDHSERKIRVWILSRRPLLHSPHNFGMTLPLGFHCDGLVCHSELYAVSCHCRRHNPRPLPLETSQIFCYCSHSNCIKVVADDKATPFWPAPVSAMTFAFPIFLANKASMRQ
jgi:hypothetical protein